MWWFRWVTNMLVGMAGWGCLWELIDPNPIKLRVLGVWLCVGFLSVWARLVVEEFVR